MSSDRSELELPFLFVGHDEPEPHEWMEAHPGWLKIPAVLVPRGGGDRSPNEPATGGVGQGDAFSSSRIEGQGDAAPFLQVSQRGGRAAPNTSGRPPATGAAPVPKDVQDAILGRIPAVDAAKKRLEDARERAFLRLLRWEENGDVSDKVAYHARLGGHDPMTDVEMQHYIPKEKGISLNGEHITGTAAGAYGIVSGSWYTASKKLGLHNFTPKDQDKIALYMIESKRAIQDIRRGDLKSAFRKLRGIWASLPGGSQSHHSEQDAISKFETFLGKEETRP